MARPVVPPNVTTTAEPTKKNRRWKAGTVALRDIKRLQRSTKAIVPLAAISRLIRDELASNGMRTAADVPEVLREAAEAFLVERFRNANFVAVKRGSVTLQRQDMCVARALTSGELN